MGTMGKVTAKGAGPHVGAGKKELWRLGKRPEKEGRALGEGPERRWLSGAGPEEAGGSKRRVRKRRCKEAGTRGRYCWERREEEGCDSGVCKLSALSSATTAHPSASFLVSPELLRCWEVLPVHFYK